MNNRGVTIVELVTSMVITATVISLMLGFWKTLNIHIFSKQRENIVRSQLSSLSEQISTNLRKSPAILEWSENQIRFIHSKSVDTLFYEFYENALHLNDTSEVGPKLPFYISNFIISSLDENYEESRLLLSIYITINDGREKEYSTESVISVLKSKD